ncbi:MAG: DUF362 domain-containing protein [Clostridiales bacterium]|nr:DUF362 domain-containing protein [Clostridiales bacterium]
MAVVAVAASQKKVDYGLVLEQLLAPFAQVFSPAPSMLFINLGLLYPCAPEWGVNPHPRLVAKLVARAYEAGVAQISLAARAAAGFEFTQCWHLCGLDFLENYGVAVVDLDRSPQVLRQSRLALAGCDYSLPPQPLKADCLISLGKFRAGSGQMFGSALNNLSALANITPLEGISPRAVVDIYSILAPDLHIIDAIRGRGGWQPQQGDAWLAATDAVALDMVLAALASLPGSRIEEIALAAQYGLGNANVADIVLVGDTAVLFPNIGKKYKKIAD